MYHFILDFSYLDSSLSEFYGGTLIHYIGPLLDLPLSPRISSLKYSNNGQSLADISHADCPLDFIVNITSTDKPMMMHTYYLSMIYVWVLVDTKCLHKLPPIMCHHMLKKHNFPCMNGFLNL